MDLHFYQRGLITGYVKIRLRWIKIVIGHELLTRQAIEELEN